MRRFAHRFRPASRHTGIDRRRLEKPVHTSAVMPYRGRGRPDHRVRRGLGTAAAPTIKPHGTVCSNIRGLSSGAAGLILSSRRI